MSSDEAAAIIGRMMLERKDLYHRDVALAEELRAIGERLGIMGRKLRGDPGSLEIADIALLDSSAISKLVSDLKTVRQRIQELDAALERAGF